MLTSYSVTCPQASCAWIGNVVPSHSRDGVDAEIISMHKAWFKCPRCQNDWEVRIANDKVTVVPVTEISG